NAARIVRALFEIALRKRWPAMTYRLLKLCKVIDKRLWDFAHPLRQFPNLSHVILNRLEEKKLTVDKLKEMKKDEIGKNIMPLTPVCFYSTCTVYIRHGAMQFHDK
ncbi:activating signal cointegrator 1 complex subunit, partial [Xenoophorus captivus]